MGLSAQKKAQIKGIIKQSLQNKLESYRPAMYDMLFYYRLLGKDRMALFSFIQSLGIPIYIPVALELAKGRFLKANSYVRPHDQISSIAQTKIEQIMDALIYADNSPNNPQEIEHLRSDCRSGHIDKAKLPKIDLWLESVGGEIFMINLKRAKSNILRFQSYKRTLLEWAAAEMNRNPKVKVNSMIAIPYNPYEPKPYKWRWLIGGMLDLNHELLLAEDFWNFIGGDGAYNDLLDCFEQAGVELRPEMDEYFKRFQAQ